MSETKVVPLNPWEVYTFPWGSAVKKRGGRWTHIFIGQQELDVTDIEVELTHRGIEFITKEEE